ncbi:hypothetical protein [Streptomyces sp. NPDC001275]
MRARHSRSAGVHLVRRHSPLTMRVAVVAQALTALAFVETPDKE